MALHIYDNYVSTRFRIAQLSQGRDDGRALDVEGVPTDARLGLPGGTSLDLAGGRKAGRGGEAWVALLRDFASAKWLQLKQ